MKSRDGKSQREEKSRREKIRKRKRVRRKEDPGARKGRKVAKHCVFPMICGSGGSKSRLAKAAGAEPAGQRRGMKRKNVQNTPAPDHLSKKCLPLWREAHFPSQMYKTHHSRTTFGS